MSDLLTHKIHSIVHQMDAIANSLLKSKFEIDFSTFMVLQSLYCEKKLSQAGISQWTGLSKGMISRLITHLKEEELIEILIIKEDKRFNHISLSKKGRCLAEKTNEYLENEFTSNILSSKEKINLKELNITMNKMLLNLNFYRQN